MNLSNDTAWLIVFAIGMAVFLTAVFGANWFLVGLFFIVLGIMNYMLWGRKS